LNSLDLDSRVEEFARLIPEHGFSRAFVLSEEAASFRFVCDLGLVTVETILQMFPKIDGEVTRKKIEQGGLFSWLFDLDKLTEIIRSIAPSVASMPRFTIGASWLPSYNAGCFLMPNGECAIIIDMFMVVCLFAFSDILIRNSGHIYVDIGFHDENGILEDNILVARAKACALEFAEYFDRMTNCFPPPLEFLDNLFSETKAKATKGLTPWAMGSGFLEIIVGHELGHASQAYQAHVHSTAVPLAISVPEQGTVNHAREFQADIFAYNMYKKASGRVVFFDYFFRLSGVYFFATAGITKLLPTFTHPPIPDRFTNILDQAVKDLVVKPHAADNIVKNYNLWMTTVIETLRNDPEHRLEKWRASWLSKI
jgi:hypothetical protein